MASIRAGVDRIKLDRIKLDRIKSDPMELFDSDVVERACREAKHAWRKRTLDPMGTLRAFATQIAHGNTAISHVARLVGPGGVEREFSDSAYCQARARLPVAVVRAAFDDFTTRARDARNPSDGRWCGHRTALIDGSDVNTPDTPALRKAFGVSRICATGSGLPSIHTLTIFDAHEGLLLDMHAAPVHTHDQRHAADLHPALRPGDVLVGDRGLASYMHMHRLTAVGCHGVFRASASWKIPFPAKRGERTPNTYDRHRRKEPLLVDLIDRDDQTIEIVKPRNRPGHATPEEFAGVPAKMVVRAVRYQVEGKGLRTREITLLTTLIDAKKYPAKDLAALYLTRWRIEVNLRHLKRTMGMDRLRCQSVDGVKRELLMFALVYNAVCHSRTRAARAQGVEPTRISFVDALRAMLPSIRSGPTRIADPPTLTCWPVRPPRTHPRQVKRQHSHFIVMRRSRAKTIKWLEQRRHAN